MKNINLKFKIFFLVLISIGIFGCTERSAAAVLFSKDFNSNAPQYGWEDIFDNRCIAYPDWGSCGTDSWAVENLPTGGWAGTGGARLIQRQGYEQDNLGWFDSSSALKNWQQGDDFYARFRIKFDSTMRWDGVGSQQNKMFIWGSGTYGGFNQRVMLHQEQDHPTSPCAEMSPEYSNSNYGLFSLKRNIQEFCTPYVPITYDVWYHIQFWVKSGTTADSTDANFKIWINNNNEASPSSELINGFNLAVVGIWNQGFSFGGFWSDTNNNRDASWIVDDFQIADSFDPLWYATALPDTTPPAAPSGLSVI